MTSPRWITAIGSLRYSDLFASGTIAACLFDSPFSLRFRVMGRPDQVVETGPKIEDVLVSWLREHPRRHQFDSAPAISERRYVFVGRDEEKFSAAYRRSRAGDKDGTVDCYEGIWQFQWLALVYFLTADVIHSLRGANIEY